MNLTCFFLALIFPYYVASSISFNFTNITQTDSQNITFSGDAAYSSWDVGIQVTNDPPNCGFGDYYYCLQNLAGRATYYKPLHLWDKVSNDLASFSTNFTFVIASVSNYYYGDGLTFFLAQNNSVIKDGGAIGLPVNTTYPFVAVEFDTYGLDDWDPKYPGTNISIGDHIGININSTTSVVYRRWFSNITNAEECRAFINYDADSKNLSVSFTNFKNNSAVWEAWLYHTIDLREVLPEWVIFGFSASTGDRVEKNNVRSWTFNSVDQFKVINENKRKTNYMLRNMGLAGLTLVVVTVSAIFAYFFWRKKNKVEEVGVSMEIGESMPRRFSYLELARSTANFAETEKLGEGGFGAVYKGFLKDLRMYVAVKRVSKTSKQGIKEYASEVRIISRLRHKNLVQLTGWCHEKKELLLVYELMENGSLDLHLFKGKSLLGWNTRYKIAQDLASALLYLHEEWEQCVLHRDIKSSNVMLDSNFNAKLGDFGLAKMVDHEISFETTMVAGTIGYMAPEYVSTGKASKESDVFSFGVVALEIACGQKPINLHAEERKTKLVEWVWDLYGTGTLLEAADPCLGSSFTKEEMMCLMVVGLWCAHPDSKLRPSIKQAIQVLNSEVPLPILPSNMPHVSYSALPHFSLIREPFSGSNVKHASTSSTTYHSTFVSKLHSM